jgi:putative flippase GtrA
MMLRQAGPYTLIAALCAGLNIAILIAGEAAGLHYVFSTALSFAACICVGYAMHCRWTFEAEPTLAGLLRYTMAMSLNFPMSLAAVWLFYSALGLPMMLAAPSSTVMLTGINFALTRWAILPKGA